MPEIEDFNNVTDSGESLENEDLALLRKNDGGGGFSGARNFTGAQIFEWFGFTKKINIPSAQVLTLFSAPVELLPAPGAGYFYQIESVYARLSGGVPTAYGSTNDTIAVAFTSSTDNVWEFTDFLSLADNFQPGVPIDKYTAKNIFINEAVNIGATTGEPTGGDQDLDVYISYKIILA